MKNLLPSRAQKKLLSTVLSKLNLLEQTMQEQKQQGISDNGSRGRPHDRHRDHYPSHPYDAHRSPTPNYAHRQPRRWSTPDRFYDRPNDRQNFRPQSRNNNPYPQDGSNQRQGFCASSPYYDKRLPSPYHRGNIAHLLTGEIIDPPKTVGTNTCPEGNLGLSNTGMILLPQGEGNLPFLMRGETISSRQYRAIDG